MPRHWKCCSRELVLEDRSLVMGILNVTPDSFSDGGEHFDLDRAVEYGLQMVKDGADIIDVGGESTRPGAARVSVDEETGRVVPVIRSLREQTTAIISVDTMKAETAAKAVAAGAEIINDISALTHDPDMVAVARDVEAGVVLMHMRGMPRTMQNEPQYDDVVEDVCDYLKSRVSELVKQGLERECLSVDPGIGFGKTVDHNLELLMHMDRLRELDVPVVMGLSRKSLLGKLTGRDVNERLAGSLAALVFCVLNGANIMRVHDVKESVDAIRVVTALKGKQNGVE